MTSAENHTIAEKTKENSYVFRSAFLESEETARLDDLHRGVTAYLGGLLPSPLEISNVKKILELGSGSGAWAIQAASEFPDAEVTAVDLNPLPNRELPSNLTFKKVDLTEPLPFEEETFDIIHARFVLMHLPHGVETFRRSFELLRPGGWLVVEEPDDEAMADGGKPLGPGMAEFVGTWIKILRSRNADPTFGRHMEGVLKSAGCFDVVNVKKVIIPISGKSDDPKENEVGAAWKRTMQRLTVDLGERLGALGITQAVAKRHLEEVNDPSRSLTTDMYFTWSRKQAS